MCSVNRSSISSVDLVVTFPINIVLTATHACFNRETITFYVNVWFLKSFKKNIIHLGEKAAYCIVQYIKIADTILFFLWFNSILYVTSKYLYDIDIILI